MTIDQRIKKIEDRWSKKLGYTVPGTTITRAIRPAPDTGMEWVLCLGGYLQVKVEFRGDTILDCLRKAEQSRRRG